MTTDEMFELNFGDMVENKNLTGVRFQVVAPVPHLTLICVAMPIDWDAATWTKLDPPKPRKASRIINPGSVPPAGGVQ